MRPKEVGFLTAAASFGAAMLLAAERVLAGTAGWENIEPMRVEVAPAKVVWTAPLEQGAAAFRVEKRDGAEGDVVFSSGEVTVEKTNDRGLIVVTAPAFAASTNQPLRFMADVSCDRGDYFYAQASLRAYGEKEDFTPCWELATRYFSMGGAEEMRGAVNQAPGMYNRKFCHFRAKHGLATAAIVVGGSPSRTRWRNWLAEDLDAADRKWEGYYEARAARDRADERMDDESFDRELAADFEHTACLGKVDGVTRLIVDGEVVCPVAYRAKGASGGNAMIETFACGPIVREGVRLVVKVIGMGGSASKADGTRRRYWTERGFDAVGAARDIKDSLRIVPGALCILAVSCNAYPNFTLKEHPDEVWIREDGSVVKGTSGSCDVNYDNMGVKDTNRWPWVSYASPSWRSAVKENLRLLIAELKRQGLSKRIVGLHLSGYHDGQFFSPYEDHSWMAKAEFKRYIREDPVAVNDFSHFSKLLGFRAQEDFARTFKRELGKPAIVIRWNMGGFHGMPDLTSFVYSDAVDVIVPQPTYETRRPGMASEMKLPYSSFDLHGKMYWNELDLRTYAALESWAKSGVVSTKGLGQMDDLAMWRSAHRKLAGMMLAHDSGYWFYDIGGGWFSTPEIARDIGDVVALCQEMLRSPRSAWRPDVAVVGDEEGMGAKNRQYSGAILRTQQQLFAASGVPFDFYLAEDALRDPSLVEGARTVVLAFFRKFDERRRRFIERIASTGRTVVFLSESGVDGGADATGFEVSYSTNSFRHAIVPAAGTPAEEARGALEGRHRRLFPDGVPCGPRCTVKETAGVRVIARYEQDGAPAIAERRGPGCRRVYVCEPAGMSAALFNRICRESGAYVPVREAGLQVDMNGDFISVHATRTGRFDFLLPFPAKVLNLKSGMEEPTRGDGSFLLDLTAGETCWFRLSKDQ